jgi:hypothetical protein
MYSYLSKPTRLAVIAGSVILVSGNLSLAQDVSWRDRGDRFEGVISRREVAGGYFDLLGVHLEAGGELAPPLTILNISFSLPTPENISIKVWEPKKNYWMVPHQKSFAAGKQLFSWPLSPVVLSLKLPIERLQVLVSNSQETLYYPAQLFTRLQPSEKKRYRFSFESKGGVELKGAFLRKAGDKLISVKPIALVEDFPGVMQVTWDGLDQTGKKVPAGIVHLRLEGAIFLSESDEKINLDIPFWHEQEAAN